MDKQEKIKLFSEGINLAGYFSAAKDDKNLPAVLFLHGSGKINSHKGYFAWQEYLTANGFASLFFDFRGCGNSEGKFEDSSLENRLKDAQIAVDFLKNHPEVDPQKISLIGGSMGGHVAIRLADKIPIFRSIILVSAAAYSEEAEPLPLNHEFSSMIRRNENWKLSPVFKILSEFNLPIMLVYSENDPVIPVGVQEAYQRAVENNPRHSILRIAKGKHDLLNPSSEDDHAALRSLLEHSIHFLKHSA